MQTYIAYLTTSHYFSQFILSDKTGQIEETPLTLFVKVSIVTLHYLIQPPPPPCRYFIHMYWSGILPSYCFLPLIPLVPLLTNTLPLSPPLIITIPFFLHNWFLLCFPLQFQLLSCCHFFHHHHRFHRFWLYLHLCLYLCFCNIFCITFHPCLLCLFCLWVCTILNKNQKVIIILLSSKCFIRHIRMCCYEKKVERWCLTLSKIYCDNRSVPNCVGKVCMGF